MVNVYIKINSKSVITEINSDIFLHTVGKYILVDEGAEDKYAHARGNYLEHGLMDDSERYNYKLLDENVVELTEAGKEELFPVPEPEPFDTEILGQMATDAEIERMELERRMTDCELMVSGGGTLNV